MQRSSWGQKLRRSGVFRFIFFVLEYVPGTPWCKRRLRKTIAKEAEARLQHFCALDSFTDREKDTLRPRVRHLQNQMAQASAWEDNIFGYVFFGFVLLILIIAKLAHIESALSHVWVDPLKAIQAPVTSRVMSFMWGCVHEVTAILSFIVCFFLVWGGSLLGTKYAYFRFGAAFGGLPIIILPLFGWAYYELVKSPVSPAKWRHYFGAAVLEGAQVAIAAGIVLLLVGIPVIAATTRLTLRKASVFPVATFLDGLLAILHIVERSPNRWREAKQGNATVVGKLELVAVCAERYLFRNIESPDPVTASHLRNKATGIAASFRSLKVSVLTAETYTRSIFTERIKSDITNAVNNNWDALIRPEAEGFQMLQDRKSSYRWLANLGTAARTLLSGGVPLVLLFVLKAKGIALAEPLNTYVTIGAYLWAFVTVLSVLDPLFAQKLAQVKRIKDFLPGKKDEMEI